VSQATFGVLTVFWWHMHYFEIQDEKNCESKSVWLHANLFSGNRDTKATIETGTATATGKEWRPMMLVSSGFMIRKGVQVLQVWVYIPLFGRYPSYYEPKGTESNNVYTLRLLPMNEIVFVSVL
jgi:hypothetical protein